MYVTQRCFEPNRTSLFWLSDKYTGWTRGIWTWTMERDEDKEKYDTRKTELKKNLGYYVVQNLRKADLQEN